MINIKPDGVNLVRIAEEACVRFLKKVKNKYLNGKLLINNIINSSLCIYMRNQSGTKLNKRLINKSTTILSIGFLIFLILSSLNLIGILKNNRKTNYERLFTSVPGPELYSSNGNFKCWYFDTDFATQTQVQDYLEVLEDAYGILVGDWNLPDPNEKYGQPPIDVDVYCPCGGYWGLACCSDREGRFYTRVCSDVITQGFAADQEPLAVGGHELFHICQFTHPGRPPRDWVLEGQARMIEDKLSDWLDHANGSRSSFLRDVWGYLWGGLHTSDLTTIDYPACLFWQYFCEQFGSVHTDPYYGADAIQRYWNTDTNPSGSNGITMLKNALNYLKPGTSFEDVFKDFSIALYAKNLDNSTTPSKWRFVDDDEIDGSGLYSTVSREIFPIPTLSPGISISNTSESVVSWSNKYYE
ncbi:MAG: hypothetical protein ACFE9T_16320, partial [Promethearchaeota archaeon]